jgi:hypothetical protein
VTVDPGSYSVSETGPAGYAAGYSSGCSGSIAIGESKTCTVTNDDTKSDSSISTEPRVLPNDNAMITGRDPGGQAKFELFDPGNEDCQGDPAWSQTVDVVHGIASTSNTDFVATAPGTWRWKVTYLGDDKNNTSTSACGVERFTIENNHAG